MNTKSLIYGLVGLVAGGAITGVLISNLTQAQPQNFTKNNPTQTQANSQTSQSDPHHPQHSQMGMMNHQQMDQHFIEMMIPHHQGAIDMADLALTKAKRPEIKKLAEAIKKDQNREIEEMKSWYKEWYGTEVPASSHMQMPMHSGMGMMGMDMMNMDLDSLKNAADFDQAFIQQMIPHHKMAVMMSAMILDSDRPQMRGLAKNIIQAQSAEIEQMRQWYQTWYQ
ncbi:MAG TPA: DUF305 domain-containing protein [Cyanobacteria bacterium UBA11162]|nr:DUF305 domain-containing protein [Cyanobacteria bacterium UBA11162]